MRGDSLTKFFNNYLEKPSIFLNKKVLQSNYTPDMIPHRNEQIDYIAGILAPCLRLEKPSNLFLYGKTGTGKTVVSKYVTSQILKVAKQKNLSIEIIYLNCKLKKVADTEYRLIVQLAKEFGIEIPPTGLPTDEVYKIFIKHLEQRERLVILILDQIDQLVKKTGDEILYNLTRINSELNKVELSIIGISNDLLFMDNVDPRVKLKPLTQRRVSEIIAELDMLGIINAKVISKGRYGRTKEIRMAIPQSTVPTIRHTLKEGLNL